MKKKEELKKKEEQKKKEDLKRKEETKKQDQKKKDEDQKKKQDNSKPSAVPIVTEPHKVWRIYTIILNIITGFRIITFYYLT